MLTADLVRARRRGDRLHLSKLDKRALEAALEYASAYIDCADTSVGEVREIFDAHCADVPVLAQDQKLAGGLRKLVEDRCEFDTGAPDDALALRKTVFEAAAAARHALDKDERLDIGQVLSSVSRDVGLAPEEIEAQLFSDLRSQHRLLRFTAELAEALVARYELAQQQAVLLRAQSIRAEVYCQSPGTYRDLLRRLKFRRLLFEMTPMEKGYALTIDGPMSLFGPSTKYGLQLALVLPAITQCDAYRIEAHVRWGKERKPLTFEIEGGDKRAKKKATASLEVSAAKTAADGTATGAQAPRTEPSDDVLLPDEVRTLRARLEKDKTFSVAVNEEVLNLPGVGVCVPDLVLTHRQSGRRVLLEVLGYWSRDAVFRRIELVEQGLTSPIIFAASTRLRVREDVLESESASLYTYKGVLSSKEILRRAQLLAAPPEDS